jgi:hypothetical protein
MTLWTRGNEHGRTDSKAQVGKVGRRTWGRWNLGKLSASQTSAIGLLPPHAMPEALQGVA